MSGKFSPTSDSAPKGSSPGLCGNYQHARTIESDRGSIFHMREISFEDPRFAKYPRLPVLVCSGHQPK